MVLQWRCIAHKTNVSFTPFLSRSHSKYCLDQRLLKDYFGYLTCFSFPCFLLLTRNPVIPNQSKMFGAFPRPGVTSPREAHPFQNKSTIQLFRARSAVHKKLGGTALCDWSVFNFYTQYAKNINDRRWNVGDHRHMYENESQSILSETKMMKRKLDFHQPILSNWIENWEPSRKSIEIEKDP